MGQPAVTPLLCLASSVITAALDAANNKLVNSCRLLILLSLMFEVGLSWPKFNQSIANRTSRLQAMPLLSIGTCVSRSRGLSSS